jgi:hypothetical protein
MPHLFTHSLDHPDRKFEVAVREEERERGVLLGRGLSVLFGLFSWHCIGYLY